MRLAPMGQAVPKLLDFSTSDDTAKFNRGTYMQAANTDYETTTSVPNWGVAELIYVANTGIALLPGTLVTIDKNFRITITAAAASVINTGQPVAVTVTNFAVGSTTEQYGWVLRAGTCPVQYSVAATAGAMFAGTSGRATPTAAAGGQILNAICQIAAVGSFTRTGKTLTGSSLVTFANTNGMYPGLAISGTGIPVSSVVSAVLTDGTTVSIGSAVGTLVTATASGSVTCTMTHTGFGICRLDRAFIQGQIT